MEELLQMVYDAVTQHIPQSAEWIPFLGTGLLALFGLLLMAKGARLAPVMSALAFLGLGGIVGSFLSHAMATPIWPSIIIAAVIGFGLGFVLFKLWLAVLVAACFAGISLSLYSNNVISPHLGNYASWNLNVEESVLGVTLPDVNDAAVAAESSQAELGQLWKYFADVIPNFRLSFWAILLSTSLAGLLFGMFLPKASRALFAATAGSFCLLVAMTALLKAHWPASLDQLKALGVWGWVIVTVIWVISLIYNMHDLRMQRRKKTKNADEPAPAGKAATA